MKLSMWMLADWLRELSPAVHIQRGERVLLNARLSHEDTRVSRTTVYLNQVQTDRVVCSHDNDYLILRSDDVNAVFNRCLDAFECYNEWDNEAQRMIASGCTARELLDFGAARFGRTVILVDATHYLRELSDPVGLLEKDRVFRSFSETRLLPLDSLLDLSHQSHIRQPGLPSYITMPAGVERPAIATNLFSGGRHKGWLLSLNEAGVYSRGDMDLQDAFGELICRWLERGDQADERMERAGMFLDLLDGRENAAEAAEERLRTFGWYPTDPKLLYVFRETEPGRDPTRAMERYLERLNLYAFLFRCEGDLFYVVDLNVTPPEPLERELTRVLERCGCVAGRSPVFTALASLPECRRAALTALRYAESAPGSIRPFEEAQLPYIIELLREHSDFDLVHPALRRLSDYDRVHEGHLTETLRELLRRRCSYAESAEALYIHRSTLLYRLQRIRDLTGLDLEDEQTRVHLEISFLLMC